MNILVGYTGFVGSNLSKSFKFDGLFNSKNIQDAYGLNPDLCVYSGVRAEKYIANNFPEEDLNSIYGAINNIKKINPKRIVLISTVDVLDFPYGDEDCHFYSPLPYGKNRRVLEEFVEQNFSDYLIVRLPGLYGINLKKNFIYDYKNQTPKLLNGKKMRELAAIESGLLDYYHENEKGFFEINDASLLKDETLCGYFKKVGFSALNFTDSRATLQFYNLAFLWNHINICLNNNIKMFHVAPEPVSIGEVYYKLENKEFVNEIGDTFFQYNLKTKYWNLFGKEKDYLFNKAFVLNDIYKYINGPSYHISVSNMAFPNKEFNRYLSILKNNRYEGVELLPTKVIEPFQIEYYDKANEVLNRLDNKLEVSSIQSILYGVELNLFNKNETPSLIETMKKVILFSKSINCNNIVFGCPKNRNMNEESRIDDAISFFKTIGDFAFENDVTIALEANPKIYNTNFINTTKAAIEFCEKVRSSGLKVNLDLGTVIYNNEDLNDIFKHADYINHIHISEPYLVQIKIRDIHYKLFEKIIESGYGKYVSLELKEGDFNLEDLLIEFSSLSLRV